MDILLLIYNNDLEGIKTLIRDKNVDLNTKNRYGETPLMYAIQRGSLDIVKLLLDNGVDVNSQNKYTESILMIAIYSSPAYIRTEMVKLLINQGAEVNYQDVRGYTPLIVAVNNTTDVFGESYDSLAVINLLIENGADVNIKNKSGDTALMYASMVMSDEVVKLLIKHGADINDINNYGETPLIYLVKNNDDNINLDKINLLLELGADPFITPDKNKTVIDYCSTSKCKQLLSMYIWEKFKTTDKIMVTRLNSQIPLGKDVWNLITLNKRHQSLCQDLSSDKNKEILIQFILEFGMPIEKAKKMSKAELCQAISKLLKPK